MEHREEIDQPLVVAVLARGRLGIPQPLHILTCQLTVFRRAGIGKRHRTHRIRTCHALRVIAESIRAVERKVGMTEAVAPEERQQTGHDLRLVRRRRSCRPAHLPVHGFVPGAGPGVHRGQRAVPVGVPSAGRKAAPQGHPHQR